MAIDGRLTYSTWETDDGSKRSKLEVTAERVVFLGSRGEGDSGGSYRESRNVNDSPPDDDVPF